MRMSRFFSEFKRRKVLRGTVAYLAVSWLVIQIASVVFPAFDFPAFAIRLLIYALAIGLIIWIPFCWIYDWGQGGFKKTEDIGAEPQQKALSWKSILLFAFFVALVLAGGALIWRRYAHSTTRIESLAVLPFQNLSDDPEQEYLVAGMHDHLITTLAKMNSIRVISKTSTLRYKQTEKSMPEIAEELGVDALIESSVLKASEKLVVNIQLIQVHPEERHLWSRAFDLQINGDWSKLFRSLSETVMNEIGTELDLGPWQARNHYNPVDSEAYRKYLQGKFHLEKLTPTGFELAFDYFNQSLAIDSTYAPVYAEMANAYVYMLQMHIEEPNQAAAKIYRYNNQALALDPDLSEAYLTKALMSWFEWDFETCRASYLKVLQENPGNALAHAFYGHLLAVMGDMTQALEHTREAVGLDPLNDLVLSLHAAILLASGQVDQAHAILQESLRLNPDNLLSLRIWEGINYATGDLQRSIEELAHFYKEILPREVDLPEIYAARGYQTALKTLIPFLESQENPQSFFIAQLYLRLKQWEEGILWIQRAYANHDSDMPYFFILNEASKAIQSDPRIVMLSKEMQLPLQTFGQR